eukprot:TRINITY_DN876_c0_g1_i3.p2 TRINITY_DN876_c0_g1~~TRINITY_DN876_c0_g1_i3.p2  ORF type:complete len:124 (+),score=16.80 TRINITY_DN876_c0_g1_i3:251-622(+)
MLDEATALSLSEVVYAAVKAAYASGNSINTVFANNGKCAYVILRKLSLFCVRPPIGIGALECFGLGICGLDKIYNECDADFYKNYVREYGVDMDTLKKIEELFLHDLKTVSYTHLTLPTIYSV